MSTLKYKYFNDFRRDMCVAKIQRPSRLGRRSPVNDFTGGGNLKGGPGPSLLQNKKDIPEDVLSCISTISRSCSASGS